MLDPHILPCEHTFCLRPCLLSQDNSVTALCVCCHLVFHVAELRPNFTVLVQICLRAWYREEIWVQNRRTDEKQNNKTKHFQKHRRRKGNDNIADRHIPHNSVPEEAKPISSVASQELVHRSEPLERKNKKMKKPTVNSIQQ